MVDDGRGSEPRVVRTRRLVPRPSRNADSVASRPIDAAYLPMDWTGSAYGTATFCAVGSTFAFHVLNVVFVVWIRNQLDVAIDA